MAMTPAQKAKLKDMFPKVSNSEAAKKILGANKIKAEEKKMRPNTATKPKPLTGPAAVAELKKQVSPSGVKKAAEAAKKATDKKYPGLYKSTASKTQAKASAAKPKATKKAPLETKRVGGIISVPAKPKKTVY
jgi:hypothetical protein